MQESVWCVSGFRCQKKRRWTFGLSAVITYVSLNSTHNTYRVLHKNSGPTVPALNTYHIKLSYDKRVIRRAAGGSWCVEGHQSVIGCQQPIGLTCFLDSLPKWFCSTTESFARECKINVNLITAIQSFPVRYNIHLKGFRTEHLQNNVWRRLACIVGVDGELESKCIDFFFTVYFPLQRSN